MTARRPLPNHPEHTTQKVRIARLMRVPASTSESGPFGLAFRNCAAQRNPDALGDGSAPVCPRSGSGLGSLGCD